MPGSEVPVIGAPRGPPYPDPDFFQHPTNHEAYRTRVELISRNHNGRLLSGLEDTHDRLVRGLREKLGPSVEYPDYRGSLEAAMWHCLRWQHALGPTQAEMDDPLLDSASRLFNVFEVGIAACNGTMFLRAYASLGARQARWSHAGSLVDRESNRSGGSKSVPKGCTVPPLGTLQGLQKEI